MTKFWAQDLCELFHPAIFPTVQMSKEEKLNALTRLVALIAVIMYFMKYEYWVHFLILGVLGIVILQCATSGKEDLDSLNGEDVGMEDDEDLKEEFSITPTYVGTDFQTTIVAPTFSEQFQSPPPAYDLYTQVPYPGDERNTFEMPLKPQSYPYGQYMTRTNLLPSDEYYVHLGCGGARTAREYVNSTFLRNDLAFRENISRIFKKKLARRWRQNCADTYSPYYSY